jgi:4-carboxymuconolactone decarboxylase
MSRDNNDMNSLSKRERELTAIGAAIASNCAPCIEYHIPQARKAGLSDSQIREAVELADKVRRVPADKILNTALAHLEENMGAEPEAARVQLDNRSSGEDNEMKRKSCSNEAGNTTNECGFDDAAAGQQNATDPSGFDFSKMMEMMQRCCPDKMKGQSSMMSSFGGGCCPSDKDGSSKESV